MVRIFFALLGLGAVVGGYLYFNRGHLRPANPGTAATFAPKETIDNARAKAKQIEQDTQKRGDDLMKRTE